MTPMHRALLAHAMTVGTPEARPDAPLALAAVSTFLFHGGDLPARCSAAMAARLGGIAVPAASAAAAVPQVAATPIAVTAVIHGADCATVALPIEAVLATGVHAIHIALPQDAVTAVELPSRLAPLLERCHTQSATLTVVLPWLPPWLSRLEGVTRGLVAAGVDALGIASYELTALERLRGWFGEACGVHAIGSFANLDTVRRALAAGATHLCTPNAFTLLAEAHRASGQDTA